MYTLQGKSDIYDMYASRVSPHICDTYASCGQSTYISTFHVVVNSIGQSYCSWEKATPDYIPSMPVDLSAGPYSINLQVPTQFVSPHSHWSSRGKVKHLLPTDYIGLLDPYLQHVISMFNTCSWVPTPQSLTNLGRGYNLRGAGFSHHSPRPSQSTLLCFALMAPSDLRLTFSSTNQPQK
jgi:hypothetical protein